MPLNIEIKARTNRSEAIREYLQDRQADYRGTDHQTDTYFHCQSGRMKLRQGNIEQSLIHYERSDQAGPKASKVSLYHPKPGPELKTLLTHALGIWKEVRKARDIYFVDNVKIHLDTVDGLGTFVEIEAIDTDGSIGQAKLLEQCQYFMAEFQIKEEDLLEQSYSDMV
ncbi:MAG: class IV adenylate cyclase [Bacteroidota bacterium]